MAYKVQQRIQESDRNQINPLHPLTYFFMTNFGVPLPFMPQPLNRPISVRFSILYRENDMKEKRCHSVTVFVTFLAFYSPDKNTTV